MPRMKLRVAVGLAGAWVIAGCSYGASFTDCAIQCSAAADCPRGLACGAEGLCRTEGTPGLCADRPIDAPDPADPDARLRDARPIDAPPQGAFCPDETDFGGAIVDPITLGTLAAPTVDDLVPSCQTMSTHDRTYRLDLPVAVVSLTIDTVGSTISDTILTLRDAACTAEIACNDDPTTPSSTRAKIVRDDVAAGSYAITVDGYKDTNNGAFRLTVRGAAAAGTSCASPLFAAGVLACEAPSTCQANTCQ